MSRKSAQMIIISDTIAIKKQDTTYIICDAYKKGNKESEPTVWVNRTYHGNLAKAIRALPDAMLAKEEIRSLHEAYMKLREISEHLAKLFDEMVVINPKPVQIRVDHGVELCQKEQ